MIEKRQKREKGDDMTKRRELKKFARDFKFLIYVTKKEANNNPV